MLSHLDENNRPRMVDVGGKAVTERTAHARAEVILPPALAALIGGGDRPDIATVKGPVFQTAIVAGIMGAKRTSELIPLCHPLPLEDCRIEIVPRSPTADGACVVQIDCRVRTSAKTGVEMEALTGASVAALALYDMGKAVSHGIVLGPIRLLEKTGGRSEYRAAE